MHRTYRRRLVFAVLGGLAIVAVIAFVLHVLAGGNDFSLIDAGAGGWVYLTVFLFVFGDAIIPVLPGESVLNAAATLAAQGTLHLSLVILAGAAGSIIGDSTLYWCARRGRRRFEPQLAKAKQNKTVAATLGFFDSSAPLVLIAGRYVPGMRWVINVTFGLSAHPYWHFLVWSALGGMLWSVYTCVLSYAVGTIFIGFPLASFIISGIITTLAVGALILVAKHERRRQPPAPHSVDEAGGGM
ncbi:MAG TPA: DedA family protein [Dehalococcoidia bacterium]